MWTAIVLTALVLVGSASARDLTDGQNGARSGYVQSGDCEVTCVIYIYCTSESEIWLGIARVGRCIFTSQIHECTIFITFCKKII